MGNEYMRRKQYKNAAMAYTEAMKSDSKNSTLYRNRAAAIAHLGLWEDVVKDTEMVVRLMPNNRKVHKAMPFVHYFHSVKSGMYGQLLNEGMSPICTPFHVMCAK